MYWLATTPTGSKNHAADSIDLTEDSFPDGHELTIYITLCGIFNPSVYMVFWNPTNEDSCSKCRSIYEGRVDAKV